MPVKNSVKVKALQLVLKLIIWQQTLQNCLRMLINLMQSCHAWLLHSSIKRNLLLKIEKRLISRNTRCWRNNSLTLLKDKQLSLMLMRLSCNRSRTTKAFSRKWQLRILSFRTKTRRIFHQSSWDLERLKKLKLKMTKNLKKMMIITLSNENSNLQRNWTIMSLKLKVRALIIKDTPLVYLSINSLRLNLYFQYIISNLKILSFENDRNLTVLVYNLF